MVPAMVLTELWIVVLRGVILGLDSIDGIAVIVGGALIS